MGKEDDDKGTIALLDDDFATEVPLPSTRPPVTLASFRPAAQEGAPGWMTLAALVDAVAVATGHDVGPLSKSDAEKTGEEMEIVGYLLGLRRRERGLELM